MDRNLDLRISIDENGNYKIVSTDPESGMRCLVTAGNVSDRNESEFNQKIGCEVLGWLELWADELKESGK